MNREEAARWRDLFAAMAEGKTIQVQLGGEFEDCEEINTQWHPTIYRIKPEPIERWTWRSKYTGYVSSAFFDTKEEALKSIAGESVYEVVKFREVLDED